MRAGWEEWAQDKSTEKIKIWKPYSKKGYKDKTCQGLITIKLQISISSWDPGISMKAPSPILSDKIHRYNGTKIMDHPIEIRAQIWKSQPDSGCRRTASACPWVPVSKGCLIRRWLTPKWLLSLTSRETARTDHTSNVPLNYVSFDLQKNGKEKNFFRTTGSNFILYDILVHCSIKNSLFELKSSCTN